MQDRLKFLLGSIGADWYAYPYPLGNNTIDKRYD